jgi:hypothetical protein
MKLRALLFWKRQNRRLAEHYDTPDTQIYLPRTLIPQVAIPVTPTHLSRFSEFPKDVRFSIYELVFPSDKWHKIIFLSEVFEEIDGREWLLDILSLSHVSRAIRAEVMAFLYTRSIIGITEDVDTEHIDTWLSTFGPVEVEAVLKLHLAAKAASNGRDKRQGWVQCQVDLEKGEAVFTGINERVFGKHYEDMQDTMTRILKIVSNSKATGYLRWRHLKAIIEVFFAYAAVLREEASRLDHSTLALMKQWEDHRVIDFAFFRLLLNILR